MVCSMENLTPWVANGVSYREGYSMGSQWCILQRRLLYGWPYRFPSLTRVNETGRVALRVK